MNRWKTAILTLLLTCSLLLIPRTVAACSVCFGNADSPQTQGIQGAILFLLAVIVSVLVAFAVFFVHLSRQAKLAAATAAESGLPERR